MYHLFIGVSHSQIVIQTQCQLEDDCLGYDPHHQVYKTVTLFPCSYELTRLYLLVVQGLLRNQFLRAFRDAPKRQRKMMAHGMHSLDIFTYFLFQWEEPGMIDAKAASVTCQIRPILQG